MSYIAPANSPLPPAPSLETPSMPPPAPTLETPFTSPSTPATPKTLSTPLPAPTLETPSTSPPTPATSKTPSARPPAPTPETPSTSPPTPATPKTPSKPPPAPTPETPSTSPPTPATPKTPSKPPPAPTPETPSTSPPTPATPKNPSTPPPAPTQKTPSTSPPTPATPKTPSAPPPAPTLETPTTSPPTPATRKTPSAPPPAPTPETPSPPTPATRKTPSTPPPAPTPETSSTSPSTPATPETSSTSSPAPTPETPSTSPLAPATPPLPPPPKGGKETDTLIGLIVGIVIGGIIMLVAVVVFIILRRRRNAIPPQGPKDDSFAGTPKQFQLNAPPPAEKLVPMPPNPTRSPQIASNNTQPLPGHVSIPPAPSSTGNGLDFEKAHPPLSPGISFGFIKSTFTYEELAMATDGFSDSNFLGQGGFGYVHKGVLPNKKQVAIKQLKVGSKQGENEFKAEVKIISRIHHKHLVSLVGYYISGAQMMLVYDFIPNNTLEFHLHGKGRPTMSWEIRMKIALGSAKGLAYLHEECQPKIIHRDIKAANILLDYNFEAKVADFGLAKFFADSETHISTRIMGTLGYLAPEYALSGLLTEKSDIFSFGVVLLELITGRRPVDKTRSLTDDSMVDWARPLLTQALEDGNFDTLVDPRLQDYNYSEMTQMVACAAVCVRHSARRRPRMSQIVRTLEGNISLADLNKGIKPGHSTVYSPFGSSDYDSGQQHSTGELSVFTSERFHYY